MLMMMRWCHSTELKQTEMERDFVNQVVWISARSESANFRMPEIFVMSIFFLVKQIEYHRQTLTSINFGPYFCKINSVKKNLNTFYCFFFCDFFALSTNSHWNRHKICSFGGKGKIGKSLANCNLVDTLSGTVVQLCSDFGSAQVCIAILGTKFNLVRMSFEVFKLKTNHVVRCALCWPKVNRT